MSKPAAEMPSRAPSEKTPEPQSREDNSSENDAPVATTSTSEQAAGATENKRSWAAWLKPPCFIPGSVLEKGQTVRVLHEDHSVSTLPIQLALLIEEATNLADKVSRTDLPPTPLPAALAIASAIHFTHIDAHGHFATFEDAAGKTFEISVFEAMEIVIQRETLRLFGDKEINRPEFEALSVESR